MYLRLTGQRAASWARSRTCSRASSYECVSKTHTRTHPENYLEAKNFGIFHFSCWKIIASGPNLRERRDRRFTVLRAKITSLRAFMNPIHEPRSGANIFIHLTLNHIPDQFFSTFQFQISTKKWNQERKKKLKNEI